MRLLKLGLGWLAICALTAAGSYYGALELDQDLGLQAKLCSSCTGASQAPPPSNPGNGTPTIPPGNPTNPPSQPYVPPSKPPSNPPNNPPNNPPTNPPGNPGNPGNVNRPPVTRPVYPPPNRTQPPQGPPTAPAPGVDVSGLAARYQALLDRANTINNEFAQIERDLKSQGQSLRGDIVSARQTMVSSMNGAAAALRARDGTTASRFMQVAEQKIDFLEQQQAH